MVGHCLVACAATVCPAMLSCDSRKVEHCWCCSYHSLRRVAAPRSPAKALIYNSGGPDLLSQSVHMQVQLRWAM